MLTAHLHGCVERGERDLTLLSLERIAQTIGVEAEELVRGKDRRTAVSLALVAEP